MRCAIPSRVHRLRQLEFSVVEANMKAISLKLPDELDERLLEMADRRKTTRSALLREAIEAYARKGKRSVTASARDLAGSVEGPKDLSTNPRHMTGFGR